MVARKGKGGKGKRTGQARRPVQRKAVRLPSGQYAWRGRAVSFGKLPKAEQSRIRASWSAKGRKAKKVVKVAPKQTAESAERRAAREWLNRRDAKINTDGRYMNPSEILASLGPEAVQAGRTLQREAHLEWVKQGKHGGGQALVIADMIRDNLGAELAAMAPQIWYYH